MTEKHFIIKLSEEIAVRGAEGRITRNSNSTQYLDVELDGWKLNEGEELYIELSHYNNDTELTTNVGPLHLFFNESLGRYVTLAPPELISVAGLWSYSIEKRFNISEDSSGELKYDSITSEIRTFEIRDTIMSASPLNSYTKESELLSAAKVLGDAILAGNSAEAAIEACKSAQASAEEAGQQAESAAISAGDAANSAADAWAGAQAAADSMNKAALHAAASAQSANASAQSATVSEMSAAESLEYADRAKDSEAVATEKANYTAELANLVAEKTELISSMLEQTKESAEDAAASAKTSEDWARQAAELFKTHSIKINADYATIADLPAEGNSQTIYFIPNGGEGGNSYDEYVWVGNKNTYEKIGSTEVDLSEYVPKSGAEMTGTLAMPKLKVDKIARNEADYIYVEPKVTMHSQVTFDKSAKFSTYIQTDSIHSFSGDDINFTANINSDNSIEGKNIRARECVKSSKVKTDRIDVGLSGSDCYIYNDQECNYDHSGAGEDGSHMVIRADSGVTVCGSENSKADIDFNVEGQIKEKGAHVYSPNNLPTRMIIEHGSADAYRNIWFNDNTQEGKPVQNSNFQYNPSSGKLKVNNVIDPFVKKAGDTMTGQLNVHKTDGNAYFEAKRTDTGNSIAFGVGSGGVNRGVWDNPLNKWILHTDGSKVYVNGYEPYSSNNLPPKLSGGTKGSSTKPIYLNDGTPTACSRDIPAVNLNGNANTSPSFYAPTSAGNAGTHLRSNGSGAPVWANAGASSQALYSVTSVSTGSKSLSVSFDTAHSNGCTWFVLVGKSNQGECSIIAMPYDEITSHIGSGNSILISASSATTDRYIVLYFNAPTSTTFTIHECKNFNELKIYGVVI